MNEVTRALIELLDARKDDFCGCSYVKCSRCERRDLAEEDIERKLEEFIRGVVAEEVGKWQPE